MTHEEYVAEREAALDRAAKRAQQATQVAKPRPETKRFGYRDFHVPRARRAVPTMEQDDFLPPPDVTRLPRSRK